MYHGEKYALGLYLLKHLEEFNMNANNKIMLYYDIACKFAPYIKV
jgi:hypothetical protein